MAARRVAKSAIDWDKFSRLVPKSDRTNYNIFKARSDSYAASVQANPENPPPVDWNDYKSNIVDKNVVKQLEAAYSALKIPYPKDTKTSEIDDQEKRSQVSVKQFCEISDDKIRQAEALREKFKIMIPVTEMTHEDYALTFPEWNFDRSNPTLDPHEELCPGISKAQRAAVKKSDGWPYSID